MKRVLALALLLLLLVALPPGIVCGQAHFQTGGIVIRSSEHQVTFAEGIIFRLEAESESDITSVELVYRLEGERAINRAYPEFTPGPRVEATWEWELERGALPPGARITYHWIIEDVAGHVLETEPVTLVYEDDRFQWQSLQGDRIVVYWYGDESTARSVLDAAIEALDRLEGEVGVHLEKEVRIYIYNTKDDMQAAIPPRSKRFDELVVILGMAVAEDTLVILGEAPEVERTVAHELSHLVVGMATRNPYGPLPRWLDEGLAMYAEGDLRPENAEALEQAIRRDELISVRSLSGYIGDPAQVDLFYGEAYSVVDFLLREYGKEKMTRLLAKFKEGTYQEDALREVYGFGLDELDRLWRASLGLGPRRKATPPPKETPARGFCWGALVPGLALLMVGQRVLSRAHKGPSD